MSEGETTDAARGRRWARHWPLLAILTVYAVLAAAYNLATPVGEAPDEPTHLEYVLYVRNEKRLPELPVDRPGLAQAKHPPLYYLAGAALSSWADLSALGFVGNPHFTFNLEAPSSTTAYVHFPFSRYPYTGGEGFLAARVMRLLSLVSGLLVVCATYALGRTVWPERRYLAWGPAAVVAFLPGFAFFSGVFNNDTLANAFSALVLLGSVRVALGHTARRDLVALGVALGLGLLTKLTIVAALGVAGLGVAVHVYRTRDLKLIARSALEVGLPVVLLFGWWIVRNLRLYGLDDPLGWGRWRAKIPQMARTIPLGDEIGAYFHTQITTFWGRFGWATISLPDTVYRLLMLLAALAVVGLAVLAVRRWRGLSGDTRWGLTVVATSVLLLYLSVFRLAFSFNLVVAHGRYVYIAIAGLALLFVTGLAELVPRRVRPWMTLGLASAMLLLSVWSLVFVLVPAFATPAPVAADAVKAMAHPVAADFDDRVRLTGYDLSAERLTPGQPLTVTLYWSALPGNWEPFPPGGAGHIAFAHAIDAAGEVVGRVDRAPFDGDYPTLAWQPGQVLRQDYVMGISPDAEPGRAAVLVGLHVTEQPEARLTASVGGEPIGDAYTIGPLVIRPPAKVTVDPEATLRGDRLGDEDSIRLLAYRLVRDAAGADLTLYWQADAAVERDLTVFAHLVDASGAPLATGDGPPVGGRYPTSLWAPGEVVADTHRLSWPPDMPADGYALRVGLYDLDSGARLPARSADGGRWPDDAVPISLEDGESSPD